MSRNASALLCTLASALALGACGKARPNEFGQPACPAWPDVAPVLEARCVSCHGPDVAGLDYELDSYLGAVALRPDATQRTVAGDSDSLLLLAARNTLAAHPATDTTDGEVAALTSWVVDCRLAYVSSRLHDRGWMNPGDADQFHGLSLRAAGYDLDDCRTCHGEELAGGTSGVSCLDCHTSGVFACNTCHGDADSPAPPRDLGGHRLTRFPGVGAHRAHLDAPDGISAPVACEECHLVPGQFDAPGHVDHAPPATVFPAASGVGTIARSGGASPLYDPATGTCTSVWCHGLAHSPSWTGDSSQIACGSCHAIPPADASHDAALELADCALCHGQTVDTSGAILVHTDPATGRRTSTHVDGTVTMGNTP